MLGHVGQCWAIFGHVGPCWASLGHVGPWWAIVGHDGQLWTMLGIVEFNSLSVASRLRVHFLKVRAVFPRCGLEYTKCIDTRS